MFFLKKPGEWYFLKRHLLEAPKASIPSFPPRFRHGISVRHLVAAVVDLQPPWPVTSVGWPRVPTWEDQCGNLQPTAGLWVFGCLQGVRLQMALARCWGCIRSVDPWQGASEMLRSSWMQWNPMWAGSTWNLTVPVKRLLKLLPLSLCKRLTTHTKQGFLSLHQLKNV